MLLTGRCVPVRWSSLRRPVVAEAFLVDHDLARHHADRTVTGQGPLDQRRRLGQPAGTGQGGRLRHGGQVLTVHGRSPSDVGIQTVWESDGTPYPIRAPSTWMVHHEVPLALPVVNHGALQPPGAAAGSAVDVAASHPTVLSHPYRAVAQVVMLPHLLGRVCGSGSGCDTASGVRRARTAPCCHTLATPSRADRAVAQDVGQSAFAGTDLRTRAELRRGLPGLPDGHLSGTYPSRGGPMTTGRSPEPVPARHPSGTARPVSEDTLPVEPPGPPNPGPPNPGPPNPGPPNPGPPNPGPPTPTSRRHPPASRPRRRRVAPSPTPSSPCARPPPRPASSSTSPAPRGPASPGPSSSASSTTTSSPACAASTPRCSPSSAAPPGRASRPW